MYSSFAIKRYICIAISILSIAISSYSAEEPKTNQSHGFASSISIAAGQKSSGSALQNPSNSLLGSASVNLYSGQHVESFPLVSLPGTGGVGISVSLDYNGNVSRQAKSENRYAQSSVVGLGFSLGQEAILVDHGATVDIYDDSYKLITSTGAVALRHIAGDSFCTETGNPWRIKRDTSTINGRLYCTGWKITREDGLVYQYGDRASSFSGLNATRTILRWGSFVGSGVTPKDSAYPSQWDLKIIRDADSLNWIRLVYRRDSAYLKVINPASPTDTQNTTFRYIRASRIDSVKASDSSLLLFQYSSRNDYQQFNGFNLYDFYENKKLDRIIVKNGLRNTLSQVQFTYDYLNNTRDSVFKKLLLKRIHVTNSNNTASLNPIHFDYQTDTSEADFGSIASITYPSGGIKEFVYTEVDNSANFTALEITIREGELEESVGVSSTVWHGDNMFLKRRGEELVLGYWDGYWNTDTFTVETINGVGVTDDGWAAIHVNDSSMMIFRWMGGYWQAETIGLPGDTVAIPFVKYGASDGVVRFFSGKDCFVVTTGDPGSKMLRANFYVWTGKEWRGYIIAHLGGELAYRDRQVQVGHGMYAIGAHDRDNDDESYLYAGKYDWEHRELDTFTKSYNFEGFSIIGNFCITTDAVAYLSDPVGYPYHSLPMTIHWRRWSNGSWASEVTPSYSTDHQLWTPVALSNGFSFVHYDGDDTYLIRSVFFNGDDSVRVVDKNLGDVNAALLASGLNALGMRYINSGNYHALQWDGKAWQGTNALATGQTASSAITFFSNGCIYGKIGDSETAAFKVATYKGNNLWDGPLVINDQRGIEPGNGFGVYRTGLGGEAKLALIDRWLSDTAQTYTIRALESSLSDTLVEAIRWKRVFEPHGARSFHVDFREAEDDPPDTCGVSNNLPCPPQILYRSSFAYRLIGNDFSERAKLGVVEKVKIKNGVGDTNPIIQEYGYYGGLMDEGGNSPRFAKVKVSTPYYSDSVPLGWTVHAFYNDISSAGFYDGDVYTDAEIEFPDLETSSFYGGVENGGHRLDGMEYYTGFYNGNDSGNMLSWTRTTYNLKQAPGMPKETYRVQPDTIVSYTEGLIDSTFLYYDSLTGLPVMTKKRANSDTISVVYVVDSTLYACKVADGSQAGILSANAITLPSEQFSYVDSANVKKYLKRSRTLYEKKGSWRPKEIYNWFNPAYTTSDSAIKTFSTMSTLSESYDARGNAINSKDAMGVITSVKYDSDSVLPVATAVNAKNTEWLYQDFEQLPAISTTAGWDTWRVDANSSTRYLNDTCVTGQYSYTIKYTASSTDTGWGPYRKISATDLTDSLYYFSCWVRTNHSVYVFCLGENSGNTLVTGGKKFKLFTPTADTWVLIQDTFDITAIKAAGGFDHLKVQLALAPPGSAKYARFDDFRLHPLDAQVSATVYNSKSLPIAGSGPMNRPTHTVYDSLSRPKNTKNWQGRTLSSTELHKLSRTRDSIYIGFAAPNVDTLSQSFIIDTAQMLPYRLTRYSFTAVGSTATIYKNGDWVDGIGGCMGAPPCISNVYDSFSVATGDTITLFIIQNDTYPGSYFTATAFPLGPVVYSESAPNWVKQERRVIGAVNDTVTVVSKTFADALGRTLQTRSTNYDGGTEKALVSGVATYDARGRAIKSYLPYYDLSSPMAVDSFSSSTQAVTEIDAYYDGNPGPDCDDVAFMENEFDPTFESPLIKAAGTSDTYKMSSGKISIFKHNINDTLNVVADTVLDPDGNLSYSVKDRWGLYSTTVSKYKKSTGSTDSVKMITYTSRYGDSTWLCVDSGNSTSEIKLRKSKFDRFGRETETWRVDYGSIRMLYDKAGRLRFMQNDKRLGENKFVYFKYDALGRKIEEGLEDSASTCFNQTKADDPAWPASGNSPTIHYKWYYDYYVNGADTLRGIGKLVRVLSGDSTYYRNYRYFPLADSNNVVVKLPTITNTKAISHLYNFDGSLKQLTISPKGLSDGTGRRKIAYRYDKSGRLESISPTPSPVDQENYALYTYEPDGKVNKTITGIYINEFTSTYDTVQVLNYRYNAAGMLTDINRIDASPWVIGTLTGDGADSDHFGMKLHYFDGDTTYYNGRVSSAITYNSSGAGVFKRAYDYRYNELGWLTKADADSGVTTTNDQRYFYNALGQRKMIITGVSDTTFYTYYTDTPGSSRLKSITGMGSVQMRYDTLGNLTADTSRSIYSIAYDYRNLPTQTYVAANQSGGAHNWIDFKYDETEQRLQKTWHYQVWALCEGGGEDFVGEGEGGGDCPPGQICGDSCLGFVEASTFYLYDDDGTLLATFDKTDAVLDLFINGPQGRIASYYQNSNSNRYYYLTDHLGSTRVTMSGVPPNASNPYTVNQYYTYHPFGGVNEAWGSYATQFKFTGKEHDKHSSFEFDYFGARYYDSRTGTFITADKAAQFLSAYLYGGNNPIMMVDRNGNIAWFVIPIIAGVVGGTGNVISNWDNISSLGQGLAFFGVGAAQGAISTLGPGAAAFAGSGAGIANTLLGGGSFDDALKSGVIGGVSGLAGGAAGKVANKWVAKLGLEKIKIPPIVVGAVGGAAGGAAGGFGAGTAAGLLSGQSFGDALGSGLNGAKTGAAFGAVSGAAVASAQAHSQGVNPFTGKPYPQPPTPSAPPVGPPSTIQQNRANGIAAENQAEIDLVNQGYKIVGRQVTVDVNGVRMRTDFVCEDGTGVLLLVEVKSGPYARLSPGQSHGFSAINEGVQPVFMGGNAMRAGLEVGVPTPDVQVTVIHYNKQF